MILEMKNCIIFVLRVVHLVHQVWIGTVVDEQGDQLGRVIRLTGHRH